MKQSFSYGSAATFVTRGACWKKPKSRRQVNGLENGHGSIVVPLPKYKYIEIQIYKYTSVWINIQIYKDNAGQWSGKWPRQPILVLYTINSWKQQNTLLFFIKATNRWNQQNNFFSQEIKLNICITKCIESTAAFIEISRNSLGLLRGVSQWCILSKLLQLCNIELSHSKYQYLV